MSQLASRAGVAGRVLARSRRQSETPVVLCIDVEPDPRVFDRDDPPPWLGFERFIEWLPAVRRRIAEATRAPVAFTWFLRMDPQVAGTYGSASWVVEAYGDALADQVENGDELGVHTHTWRWEADAGEWVADNAGTEWGDHCVTVGLDAFESAFGRPCEVHRGGDAFLSGRMLACLAARGVKVDLTVEPGLPPRGPHPGERARGLSPDYRDVPTHPYRSTAAGFPAPDQLSRSGPLLVPLLSAPGRRFRRTPLSAGSDPVRFVPRLAAELVRSTPAVVAVAVRTDIALDARLASLASNLEHLARHRRTRFMTVSDAVRKLDGHVGQTSSA